uniref:Uncharacterized protein n=1 Tax=Oryza rufipogon TaxID=4529 RepID=A0A0E0NI82_ORYRU
MAGRREATCGGGGAAARGSGLQAAACGPCGGGVRRGCARWRPAGCRRTGRAAAAAACGLVVAAANGGWRRAGLWWRRRAGVWWRRTACGGGLRSCGSGRGARGITPTSLALLGWTMTPMTLAS